MQTSPQVPSNTLLYSLAEHVQFREDGWHDEAIRRAVACTLHERSDGIPQNALTREVTRVLGITVEAHAVVSLTSKMLENATIVESGGRLHLSQAERTRLDEDRHSADAVAAACRARFDQSAKAHGTYGSISWENLVKNLIVPMTSELGARTFDLLRGATPIHDTSAARNFIAEFSKLDQDAVRDTILDYLDPTDPNVRSHLLGYLTSYTLVAARGMSESQVKNLISLTGRVDLDIIIDTNVAFSMLGLHRNPQNDATSALLSLKDHVGSGVSLRFHILESTIAEARRSLNGALQDARGTEAPRSFEKAAETSGFLSGLLEGYFHARNENRLLSPESYFKTYINGFEAIINQKGIDVIEDSDTRELRSTQNRVDNWMSYEWGRQRPKTREQLEHDVTAMEVVRIRRASNAATATSARWWFVTADFRLQSRERKDLAGGRRLPATINPAELVQLVRLWVPRTSIMEEALVGAIRMPFAFYSYDPQMEKSALRILRAVAGIEGVEGLDEAAALRVFHDMTLRTQLLNQAQDGEGDVEVVAEAVERVDLQYRDRALKAEKQLSALQDNPTPPRANDIPQAKQGGSKNEVIRDRDRLKKKSDRLESELKTMRSQINPAKIEADVSKQRQVRIHDLAVARASTRLERIRWLSVILGILLVAGSVYAYFFLPEPKGTLGADISIVIGAVALVTQFIIFLPKRRVTLKERLSRRIEQKLRENAGFTPELTTDTAVSPDVN